MPIRVPDIPTMPNRVPDIPTMPIRVPDITRIPRIPETETSYPTVSPIPSPTKEVFTHNGTKYQCEWVYCCHPISNSVPEKLEPSIFEESRDIVLWTDNRFPEYKIDKCNNAIGFCLRTRNSTFRLIFRVIYPSNIPNEVRDEIYQCAEEGATAAVVAITAQVAAMRAAPPSIPALLPNLLEIAYVSSKTAFIRCIGNKASFEYIEGKIRYSVYHEQTSNEDWKTFSDTDALDLIKQFYLYSSGLILIPGIGDFKDLSDKIGIDLEGIDNFVKNPGKTIEDWKDKASKEISKPLDRIFRW